MIKNLWNVVKIVCAEHEHTPDMVLEQATAKKLQYKCIVEGCRNMISVDDYDGVIKKISDEIEKAELEDSTVNLKNMKWKAKGIEYTIICFKESKIVVKAINKKMI